MRTSTVSAVSGVLGASLGSDQDVYTMLVDAAVEQRDADTLRKYAPAAEEAATRLDHRLHMGIAHRAWGVLHTLSGDYPEAHRRLELALEMFERYLTDPIDTKSRVTGWLPPAMYTC